LFAATVASVRLWSQAAEPAKLEFEVASIRPSGPLVPGELSIGLHIDGAQIRGRYFSLKDYLGMAYKLKNYQITGPDWVASDRFDITAKLPEGAKADQVPEMLQSLLASRFEIKMHRETKPFPVYGLLVAKGGLKLEALKMDADGGGDSGKSVDVTASGARGGVSINLGKGSSFSMANNKVEVKKLTMVSFADLLARFEDRPVVDMTDVKGSYDFTLEFTPEDFRTMMIRSAIAAGVTLPPEALHLLDGASDSGLQTALQTVGLKLEPRKAPIEVLIVDKADKSPIEN
jgi:uncharacterized protein (TIGR03435 family)